MTITVMATFDWLLTGIVIGGLIVIATIIVRKFPLLSAIDLKTLAGERHREIKDDLLESRVRRKLGHLLDRVFSRLAPSWKRMREQAAKAYTRLIELERESRQQLRERTIQKSGDAIELQRKASALFIDARTLLDEGKLADAEKRCIEIISLDHDHVQAYELLADLYQRQEQYANARDILLHLMKLTKIQKARGVYSSKNVKSAKLATYYSDICAVYQKLGDVSRALDYCRKAVDVEPKSPKMLDALVQVSVAAQERAIAQDALSKMEKVNPDNQKLPELRDLVGTLKKTKR